MKTQNIINIKFLLLGLTFCVLLITIPANIVMSDQWTTESNMIAPRWGLSASAINGKIYAIGGIGDNNTVISAVEEYDPTSGIWIKKAGLPFELHGLSTCLVNGKIYAIGGTQDNNTVSSAVA